MAESIVSQRRVLMTGWIRWQNSMWGVGQTENVCIDILNFYSVLRYDNKKDVSDSEIYINGQEVKKCKQRESMK